MTVKIFKSWSLKIEQRLNDNSLQNKSWSAISLTGKNLKDKKR